MNETLLNDFKNDLTAFHEATHKFYAKEMSVAQYKGFSGGFGSYAQRGGEKSMLRLRLTGGEISRENLEFIADSIEKYDIDRVHLTTCQSIQLHNLNEATICALIEEAFAHGIITRGGGGDYPRNVMASPLSGVQKGESFDVMPYAKAAADFLMPFIHSVKLPRKLKVCFSNGSENVTHATFRDLGFMANDDGTFDVYSAGGLGNHPKMGVCVGSHVSPEKILYYIKAMIDTFTAYGNYENRGRARTRYMQDTLGVDGYKAAFKEKLDAVMASEGLDLKLTAEAVTKTGDETDFIHKRVTAQKQKGLYALSYQPLGGNPAPEMFRKLSDALKMMPEVLIRLTPGEGMYFINCTKAEALKLIEITDDSAQTLFETSVACIGTSICQVGARDSQALLSACIEAVRKENFADGVLPKIRISGCPSSCSAHQAGAIAFRGGVKQTPDGPKPAFAMYVGGCETQGREKFGKDMGIIKETDIPEMLVEIGRAIALENTDYETWIQKNEDVLETIVKKYV